MEGAMVNARTMLAAAAAKWQADTAKLAARLSEHGQALRTAGLAYEGADEYGAAKFNAAVEQVTELDFGL